MLIIKFIFLFLFGSRLNSIFFLVGPVGHLQWTVVTCDTFGENPPIEVSVSSLSTSIVIMILWRFPLAYHSLSLSQIAWLLAIASFTRCWVWINFVIVIVLITITITMFFIRNKSRVYVVKQFIEAKLRKAKFNQESSSLSNLTI